MFSQKAKDGFATTSQEIRQAGLFKEERVILTPQGLRHQGQGRRGHQLLRQQLPGALQPPQVGGGCQGRPGEIRLRHVFGAFHLRHPGHPQDARAEDQPRSWAPRTRFSTPPASTPTAAFSRRSLDAECAIICRRAQPRQRYRRHQALQGGAQGLPARRHGDLEARLQERPERQEQDDRHRRRLLHGRRPAHLDRICDLADKYDAMVMVDDSPLHGLHRQDRPRDRRAVRRAGTGSTSSRPPWAKPWAGRPAASPAAAGLVIMLRQARGPTSSRTPCARRLPTRRSRLSRMLK